MAMRRTTASTAASDGDPVGIAVLAYLSRFAANGPKLRHGLSCAAGLIATSSTNDPFAARHLPGGVKNGKTQVEHILSAIHQSGHSFICRSARFPSRLVGALRSSF
jgi:hypothetical protein